MRISFKNDISANYMVIENVVGFSENEFGVMMLKKNKIGNLLDFGYEQINGKTDFLYDISSRQAFSAIIEGEKLDCSILESFVISVKSLSANLEEFLLDGNNIMLKKECIFAEPGKKQFGFCYNPYYKGDFKLEMGMLFDELISFVDYNDPKAVKLVYELHRESHRENFTADSLAEIVLKENSPTREPMEDTAAAVFSEPVPATKTMFPVMEETMPEIRQPDKPDKPERPGVFKKISAYLKGKSLSDVVEDIDNGKIVKKIKEAGAGIPYEAAYDGARAAFKEPEVYMKIENAAREEDTTENQGWEGLEWEARPFVEDNDGETELFESPASAKRKLVGESLVIDINEYPFTVGKIPEKVNVVLDSPAVSRMHCRIHENPQGIYFLEDLNSKNGSFINSTRLEPYSKMPLSPGDIIRIAGEEFCFR